MNTGKMKSQRFSKRNHKTIGFTLIELLIVITIIGILAAITVIAYVNITGNAAAAVLKSDIKEAAGQLALTKASDGSYPASSYGLPKSADTEYQYTLTGGNYCLSATSAKAGETAYHISNTTVGGVIEDGVCSGHTIPGSSDLWDTVAAGSYHACGIASGQAYCWGANWDGEFGNNSTVNSSVPVAVDVSGLLSGKTVTSISPGAYHTCAMASGQAYCWGSNNSYQFGNNDWQSSLVPTTIYTSGALSGKTVTGIFSQEYGGCVIASAQAYCWGDNRPSSPMVPVAVDTSGVLSGKTVTSMLNSYGITCVIASGQVYCWGSNSDGQLGNNSTTDSSVPVAVDTSGVLAGKTVTSISMSNSSLSRSACAIASGQAYCWGNNSDGQLGNNSTTDSSVPVAVDTSGVLAGKTVTSISTSDSYTCAVASGQAYCWGNNSVGQLGNNSTTNSLVPVAVGTLGVLSGKTVTSISTGGYSNYSDTAFTCAVASGQAYCWGHNQFGQLGNNSTTDSPVPVRVSPLP